MPTPQDNAFGESNDGLTDEGRPGLPVDPGRLWISVKRDWRWIPLAGAIWFALALIVAFVFISHSYKSETVLIWEPAQERAEQRQLATEAGTMKLPGMLRRVREELKLKMTPKALEGHIEVFFDARSNLVTVEAAGSTAAESARLADGVVTVFLKQQREIMQARALESAKMLEHDLGEARARLEKAHGAYDAYRTEHGVADIEQEKQLAIDNVSRLKQEQQQARGEATSLDTRARELGSLLGRSQRTIVQSASTANPDAQQLAQLRTELATAKARYSSDHPRLQILESQVAALEASTRKQTNTVSAVTSGANPEYQMMQQALSTAKVDHEALLKRDKQYDEFIAKAEQRVAELSGLEGKARGLIADIQLATTRITELETQLARARDAASSPQIEWRVLTPAVQPEWPERSKRRAIVFGMPVAGMLFALVVLLLRPLVDGRIHTAREAAWWANLPVISSSAWPRRREMFFTLVDELGDQSRAAGGYTLVLGITTRENPLAEELAYWLGGAAKGRRDPLQATRREVAVTPPAPGSGWPQAAEYGGGGGGGLQAEVGGARVARSEALVPIHSEPDALVRIPQGTHAWLGASEGPALRRAARMADRVIVLMSSGTEPATSVLGLRTRLGREHGVGLVLLGVSPQLMRLPDRVGDVDKFWRYMQSRLNGGIV